MGLRAEFSVYDLGFPIATDQMNVYADYSFGSLKFIKSFIEYAKELVPVDTGYLQSSISAKSFSDGTACLCEAKCEYAQYVEYGTVYMGAQPYFEPAIIMALQDAMPKWIEAWGEALKIEQELLAEQQARAAVASEERMERGKERVRLRAEGRLPSPSQQSQTTSQPSPILPKNNAAGGLGSIVGMTLGAFLIALINIITSELFDLTINRQGPISVKKYKMGALVGEFAPISIEITQEGD